MTLEGEIAPLDDLDNSVVRLPTKTGKTDKAGNLEIDFPLDDFPKENLAVIVDGTFKGGPGEGFQLG